MRCLHTALTSHKMEKININFLDFEIKTVIDGLRLLKQEKNTKDLIKYIISETKKQSPYTKW